jgi:16S rRNA (guanine1207-N2)-methyltransferase
MLMNSIIDPAQALILEHLHPKTDDRILALEGGDGQMAARIADLVPNGEVLCLARDARDVWAAQVRLKSITNATTTQDVIPPSKGWDTVLITIPKERRYARYLLVASWEALKPGGNLILAGPTRGGAKAVIKDAERLFGNSTIIGYRNHQRVAICKRGDSLPKPLPIEYEQTGIKPGTINTIKVTTPMGSLVLETHPGIFSWEALDEGTALLLEHLAIEPGWRVWDVGCGYGAIGLSTALAGASQVLLSDINLLGVGYTQRNAIKNKVSEKVAVILTDGLSADPCQFGSFDLIVSNPAFHQGRKVNKSMADALIAEGNEWLTPNGRLVIVANRFLNYDRYMRNFFQEVKKIFETNKYHVIEATNAKT